MREIRSTIFQLHSGRTGDRSLRRAALELAAESARTLGFDPTVRLEGPVDTVSDGAISDHLLAAQREALANVARHAAARSVEVVIRAHDGELTLVVRDDGVGIGDHPTVGGRGLENLRSRARQLGGTCTVERCAAGGTRLTWTVPTAS